ncbi:MAG: TetR/AcrR family transcriptional regulator [Proteobacteria bacterium]|nr:TetR/AcrR family transcriptional regulator [Pseudomonadota bacterium]
MCKTDKRDDILSAAMELMAEQGFHGAPMAMIADKAGVGAGTIYRYFENRDVLIRDVYHMIYDEFVSFLLNRYPTDRPVRECFFHIGKGIIDYLIRNPLKFRYTEQFHNSPYGLEFRKLKLSNDTGEFDFGRDLYYKGLKHQVIKEIPLPIFFDLAFAPIFWAVRDHHTGFVVIDDALAEVIVSSCWDSIRI